MENLMTTLNIKIVDLDATASTILVKYTSEKSLLPIDAYAPTGFQITSSSVISPETFIESVRAQISYYVAVRDAIEAQAGSLDLASWVGFETSVEAADVVDPAAAAQIVAGLNDPEVEL
jgi:hypothetical protein